jgi:hypothetical protein
MDSQDEDFLFEIHLNNVKISISYLTENTLHLHYKDQINNSLFILSYIIDTPTLRGQDRELCSVDVSGLCVCQIRQTQLHFVGKIENSVVLMYLVHVFAESDR